MKFSFKLANISRSYDRCSKGPLSLRTQCTEHTKWMEIQARAAETMNQSHTGDGDEQDGAGSDHGWLPHHESRPKRPKMTPFDERDDMGSYLHRFERYAEIFIIISGFGIYGAAVVPDSGVGNTWQRLTLVLHEFLSNGQTPSRPHTVISFLTHADHVFLGLPRFLVPGTPNRMMELMQEVARCTCPYHLRRRVRRTAVISSTSSFW